MPKELEIFGTKPANGYKAVFGNERGNLAEDIALMTGEVRVLNYVDDTLYSMSFFVFLLTV